MISVFLRTGITSENSFIQSRFSEFCLILASKYYSTIGLPFIESIDIILFKINKEATRKSVLYISLL